jgi:hypothetical protein
LQRLLVDIRARKVDNVVVYKVDRLTRSLTDFAKLVELFDAHGVSFVSVTQARCVTTSTRPAVSDLQNEDLPAAEHTVLKIVELLGTQYDLICD